MNTVASYDQARDFLPGTRTRRRRLNVWRTLRLVAEALREGHVAAHRYHELIARGVAHDKAARQVFAEVYAAR